MRLPFELDPQIIHHIIYSQAGSIGKAIIELLMNAVDAQASEVCLSLTRDGFECSDNGNRNAGFITEPAVLFSPEPCLLAHRKAPDRFAAQYDVLRNVAR